LITPVSLNDRLSRRRLFKVLLAKKATGMAKKIDVKIIIAGIRRIFCLISKLIMNFSF